MKKGDIVYYLYQKSVYTNTIEWDYSWGEVDSIDGDIVRINKLFIYNTTHINGVSVYNFGGTDWVKIPNGYKNLPPKHPYIERYVIKECFSITNENPNPEEFKVFDYWFGLNYDRLTELERIKAIKDHDGYITRHSSFDFHKSYKYEIADGKIRLIPAEKYTEETGYTDCHISDVFDDPIDEVRQEIEKRNNEWNEWKCYVDTFEENKLCDMWDIEGVINQYCKMFPYQNKDFIKTLLQRVMLPYPARLLLRIWGNELRYKHYIPPRAIHKWDCGYTDKDIANMTWKNLW